MLHAQPAGPLAPQHPLLVPAPGQQAWQRQAPASSLEAPAQPPATVQRVPALYMQPPRQPMVLQPHPAVAALQPQPPLQPPPAAAAVGFPPLRPGKVLTASFFFDGQQREIRYGPGLDFESPDDFFTPCHSEWSGPYQAMLDYLDLLGWFEGLPLDPQGILNVAAPFCGSMQELPVLVSFLVQRFPGVNGIHILCSDLENWAIKGGYWRQKEKYFNKKHPGVKLQFRTMDLTREAHPSAALTFGIHPECTAPNSPWPQILTNVLRSTTGVCMIATFKPEEMEVVRDICHCAGAPCEVHENPHWQSHPLPPGTLPPFLHYLVLIRKGLQRGNTVEGGTA